MRHQVERLKHVALRHGVKPARALTATLVAVGMMAAVEVAVDGTPGARGHELQKRLFDAGVNLKATGDNLIVAPPFVSEKSHVDHIVSVLRNVLSKA